MFMKKVMLNAEQSKAVFDRKPSLYKPKECYANIYRAATEFNDEISSGKWKIAYGYYDVSCCSPILLARHCFFLNENNEVIDPTVFTRKENNLNHTYYVMYVFQNWKNYFSAIIEEMYYPALEKYLNSQTKLAYQWAAQNGYILCG